MDLTTIENKLEIILKEVEALKSNINGNSVTYKEQPYESKETNELNEAIAKASLEFPKIKVNRQNPYLASGYSDLHEIMNKIRPILGKFGIHVVQQRKLMDGASMLTTKIWHSSGQWIESRVLLNPSKNTIEAYGSNLNSMKRFEIMDMLGLTVSNDPFDDDGEADMELAHEVTEGGAKLKTLYNKKNESYDVVTAEQYGELKLELDTEEDLASDILDNLHIKSLRELPRTRFLPTISRIRTIKKKRYSK